MNEFKNDMLSSLTYAAEMDYDEVSRAVESLVELRAKHAKSALEGKEQAPASAETCFYINRRIISILGVYLPELDNQAKIYPDLERYAKIEREEKL